MVFNFPEAQVRGTGPLCLTFRNITNNNSNQTDPNPIASVNTLEKKVHSRGHNILSLVVILNAAKGRQI